MPASSLPLAGKVALVTGGSRGIGAAIVRKLAEDGADVAISYSSSAERAEALVRELTPFGVQAAAFQADQSRNEYVTAMVRDVVSRFGWLDILVNNAGVFTLAHVDDPQADIAAIRHQQAVNIDGVAAATRAAAPLMIDGGRIINIGSNGADHIPFAGSTDYAATKAAVAACARGWARGWARDLGKRAITVNTIQSGPIATEMNPDSGDFADALKGLSALGRYGKPEEIAAAVAFLAGPGASFVTGATLTIDGGISA